MDDDCAFPFFEELPSMPEMIRELSQPINGQKTATLTTVVKEAVQTYYFVLIFFVVACFLLCVREFNWKLWGANDFINSHAKSALLLLVVCVQLQVLYKAFIGIRFILHLSTYVANEAQQQFNQERLLAKRLSHIAPNLLQQCRKRVEMEIDILKQMSLVAVLLSAVIALGQLHFASVPVIQGAVLGVILLIACILRMIRQYSRLVFALNSAEKMYSPAV